MILDEDIPSATEQIVFSRVWSRAKEPRVALPFQKHVVSIVLTDSSCRNDKRIENERIGVSFCRDALDSARYKFWELRLGSSQFNKSSTRSFLPLSVGSCLRTYPTNTTSHWLC